MARRRKKEKQGGGGGTVLALLVLLAIVGGYGTWNYQRNLEAEAQVVRPYRGYSDADLAALESAYRGEVDALNARYAKVSGRKVKVKDVAFGQAQVDEFERVQRVGRQVRELGYQASLQQATLDEVVKEREFRKGLGPEWQIFLKRALWYRG